MKLAYKIGGSFLILIMISVLTTSYVILQDRQSKSYFELYAFWSKVDMVTNEDVTQNLLRLQTCIKEFYLNPFSDSQNAIIQNLANLKRGYIRWKSIIGDNKDLQDCVSHIGNNIDKIHKYTNEFKQKTDYKTLDKILKLVKDCEKVIDATMETIIDPQKESLLEKFKESNNRLHRFLVLFTVIAVIISTILSYLITINITNPVAKVLDVATQISKGDIRPELVRELELNGNDEISEMASMLREMTSGIIGQAKSLKESIPAAFFITDKDLKITYANDLFCKLVNKSSDELQNSYCGDMVCAEQCNTEKCLIKRALEERKLVRDVAVLGDDDDKKYFNVYAKYLADLNGNIIGCIEILVDVTEETKRKKQIEENHMILQEASQEVLDVSNQVASAAEELNAVLTQMANGAEEQSEQATQIAAAVEEMSATIMEMTKNINEAATVSDDAKQKANQGVLVIKETSESVSKTATTADVVAHSIDELSERSKEIGNIIEVISEIASQTNLLALNATIEAASAGEAGKGFAVVASEVKELAKQTAESTNDVRNTINNIHRGIKEAVDAMKETSDEMKNTTNKTQLAGKAFNEILTAVENASSMVLQVATAAEELSSTANNVSENVMQITQISNESAEQASEAVRASNQLAELSQRLLQVVNKLSVT